ncbi:hypothetical protein THAOC_23894, partial [Thalassiosira oceanica]
TAAACKAKASAGRPRRLKFLNAPIRRFKAKRQVSLDSAQWSPGRIARHHCPPRPRKAEALPRRAANRTKASVAGAGTDPNQRGLTRGDADHQNRPTTPADRRDFCRSPLSHEQGESQRSKPTLTAANGRGGGSRSRETGGLCQRADPRNATLEAPTRSTFLPHDKGSAPP